MAKGRSGRIVIEIDPTLKNKLYSELIKEGRTLKEWFIEKANEHIERQRPVQLEFNGMFKSKSLPDHKNRY